LKSGFNVEKAWTDNYYGFTLDGDHLYLDGEFLIHHNSGKSIVVAKLAQDAIGFGSQVLVLAHRKELLEQNAEKVRALLPGVKVGLFSSGLRSWDAESPVVLAGIQSCWQKASIFGPRHLVLIDEAHLVSTTSEGMYRSFLSDLCVANPVARLVGLTATPYRTGEGSLTGPEKLFQGISYEAKIPQLIREGFLSPITSRAAEHSADTSKLHVRAGEFVTGEMEQLFGNKELVRSAVRETVEKSRDRRSIILFCAGIEHAESVAEELRTLTSENVGVVTGASLPLQRANDLRAFREGSLRWLVNVDVLTTGFDAPNIDAIAVLRATCSPGLFAQICGRGFRLAPGKNDCLVLDFGENIKRHGPLDADDYGVRSQPKKGEKTGDSEGPTKVCPNCQSQLHAAARECSCGFLFPPPAPRHGAEAGSEELLSAMAPPQRWLVDGASMQLWTNKKTGSRTLRVDYQCQLEGASGNLTRETISEWVCLEHAGYAGMKANKWWAERCSIPVTSIDEALAAWGRGAVGFPTVITTKREGRFYRVTAYAGIVIPEADEWLDEPSSEGSVFGEEGALDEVPF
jgi:DNA repair protein RadD